MTDDDIKRHRAAAQRDLLGRSFIGATVLALFDRLEAAERDARRYRGLRESALMDYPSAEGSNEPGAYLTVTGYGDNREMIDRAVDTALAAREGER